MTTPEQMENQARFFRLPLKEALRRIKDGGIEYCPKCKGYVDPIPVLYKATGLENQCPDCGTFTVDIKI